jgi:hypothetical protein
MEITNQIINWLSLLVIIMTFIMTILYPKRKNLAPIKLYIFISIIANLILNFFDVFLSKGYYRDVEQVAFNIYSILEISLIFYFLYFRIKNKRFRTTMLITFCLYISICISSWILNYKLFFSFIPEFLGIEGIIITICCLYYMFEILKSEINTDLKSDSNFIATCGILFYFSLSIPTYFSWYNLRYYAPGFHQITILANSIFYTILFISFMKAYICPIPNQL